MRGRARRGPAEATPRITAFGLHRGYAVLALPDLRENGGAVPAVTHHRSDMGSAAQQPSVIGSRLA
ncbi:MAG: hypothetical protein Kow0073_14490 [Immundisolibacter sp.]